MRPRTAGLILAAASLFFTKGAAADTTAQNLAKYHALRARVTPH